MGKAALFIVLLISAILVVIIVKTMLVGDRNTPTPTALIERAKGIECLSNLRSIRARIDYYYSENSRYPAALNVLESIMPVCPVSKEAYRYDGATGRLTCPSHPNY